jgi:hypothetical protein
MAEHRLRRSLFNAVLTALQEQDIETAEDFWQVARIPVWKANTLLAEAKEGPWDCETSLNLLIALGVPLYIRAGEVEIMQVRTDEMTGQAIIDEARMSERRGRLPLLSERLDDVLPRREHP